MLSIINILIRADLFAPAIYLAKHFIKHSGDLNRRDFFGVSVAESIIKSDRSHYLGPMMKLGWKPSGRLLEGMTALSASVALNRGATFSRLLALRVNPAKRNIDGSTALMIAAQVGDSYKLKRLLQQGANPNDQDPQGWTAAHRAAFYRPRGWKAIVRTLIEHGFDPEIQDYTGKSVIKITRK